MIQMTPCYIHIYAYTYTHMCMKANGEKIKKVKKVLKKNIDKPARYGIIRVSLRKRTEKYGGIRKWES